MSDERKCECCGRVFTSWRCYACRLASVVAGRPNTAGPTTVKDCCPRCHDGATHRFNRGRLVGQGS